MNIHTKFEVLGYKYNTDKVVHHGYHRTYPVFLEHLRTEKFSMLEIGIDKLGSVGLWKDYFPDAKIYALDIEAKPPVQQVTFFKADQSDSNELKVVCEQIPGKLRFIIDDGSHIPEHQLTTINTLWEKLEDGGIYIIEDIETSYWENSSLYGYDFSAGIQSQDSVVNEFKKVVHHINKEFIESDRLAWSSKIDHTVINDIESVTFSYNAIILIKKRKIWQRFYNREYRFNNNKSTA